VTRQNVFELMPFENELVVLTLPGPVVQQVLHWIAVKGGEPVSGLQMKIRGGLPEDVRIGGRPFDPARTYKVVTSSYLANGGSDLHFLDASLPREYAGLKIRDAVIRHIGELYNQKRSIDPRLDARIQYE
jgi:2',3'-cyclic-nucleotide 2'-phosphodiesterase (5'-nucleotidase family)